MQVVDQVGGELQPGRGRTRRAARATQLARLWALSDTDEAERDALRSRLQGLDVDEPQEEPAS